MSRAARIITRHDESVTAVHEAAPLQIEVSKEDGYTFYLTTVRQTNYTITQNKQGEWEVWSKRKNMATMGQIRHFPDLEALEKAVKGLRGIAAFVADLNEAECLDDQPEAIDVTGTDASEHATSDVDQDAAEVSEKALDHDADDSYEAALHLLLTLAKANGYRKGAKALADTMEIGKHEPIELDELVDYFEGSNDHNVAGVATAMKRKRPDWVLVALMELEKIQAKSNGVTEAFTRLRVAIQATDSMTKSMTSDLSPVTLDGDLTKVVNAIPAKDRKNLVANWKFEF